MPLKGYGFLDGITDFEEDDEKATDDIDEIESMMEMEMEPMELEDM